MYASSEAVTPSMVVPEKAGAACRDAAGVAAVMGPLVPAVVPPEDPQPVIKTKADTVTRTITPHDVTFENRLIHLPPNGEFVSL